MFIPEYIYYIASLVTKGGLVLIPIVGGSRLSRPIVDALIAVGLKVFGYIDYSWSFVFIPLVVGLVDIAVEKFWWDYYFNR